MDWREASISAGVGPGWERLVDELHRRVLEVAPDVQVAQVKEKFGGLRYYYDLPGEEVEVESVLGKTQSEVVEKLVDQAELVSTWICEVCGKPGHTDGFGHGWLLTLCPEHAKRRREQGTPAWQMAEEDAE